MLRQTKMQSTLKVDVVGEATLGGTPLNAVVIDLTQDPYAHGFHWVSFVLQNAALTGDLTIKVAINPEADGSGTDVYLGTMVLDAADSDAVFEVVGDMVSYQAEQNDILDVKSLVLELSGTATDTVDVAVVAKPMQEQDGLTPTDVTTVS